jgi:guanidinobutyrase
MEKRFCDDPGDAVQKPFCTAWRAKERKRMSATPVDHTMWTSLLHAGLAGSFLRLPHVPPQAAALREANAGAAIYGLPFDATNISRTGANYGPRGIREVSAMLTSYNATLDFDLLEALRPVDAGDCDIALANPERTFRRAQADIGEILDAGALPVTLGGDHSVTIPAVRAVRERVADPGLVLIDMHLDTAQDVGGEELNHCCPITRAVDAGFDPAKIALVGISGWMNPKTEIAYCRERGITVIWLEDIWEHGTAWAVERALEVAGASPGGLTSREAIELVRGVSGPGLIGVDVVENAPTLDPTPSTSLISGRIALEAMAFHAGAGRS